MNDPQYQVLGRPTPSLLARSSLYKQLCNHLERPTPAHTKVIGPRYYGKTVLLKHFAKTFPGESKANWICAYWDLRYKTPDSDGEFRRSFASVVSDALEGAQPDLAALLRDEDGFRDAIDYVLKELSSASIRVAMILDGFDHLMAGTSITRNIWDELLALSDHESLKFITGSRRPLSELCESEEERTSNFWGIFDLDAVRVGPFLDEEFDDLIRPLARVGIGFDQSGRKEVFNWTGGIPLLVAVLLRRIEDGCRQGDIVNGQRVCDVGVSALDGQKDYLASLWNDLASDIQHIFADLCQGELQKGELSDSLISDLAQRGLAKVSGSRIKSSCELLRRFVSARAEGKPTLHRIFGEQAAFIENVRELLFLRLDQLGVADETLRRRTRDLIAGIGNPHECVYDVRQLVKHALKLIWNAELPSPEDVPESWTEELAGYEIAKGRRAGQAAQIRAWRNLTGGQKSKRLTCHLTKPTFLLLEQLYNVGNFGQHLEDNDGTYDAPTEAAADTAFAAAVCWSAVQLCAALTRDFSDLSTRDGRL